MPRKQRFKPSRKPKPIPQAEDTMVERQSSIVPPADESFEEHGARQPDARDDMPTGSESDDRLR
jgi:hypothetical protein